MFRLNTFTQCVSFKHIYDVGILVEQLTAITFDKKFERVLVVIYINGLGHSDSNFIRLTTGFILIFFQRQKKKEVNLAMITHIKLPTGISACLSVTSDWQYSANTGHMSKFIFSLVCYKSLGTAHLTAMLFCLLLASVLITRVNNFPLEYSVPIRLAGTGVHWSLQRDLHFRER